VCGSAARHVLYRDLVDRLFGAPGRWTMYRCDACHSGYLDPRPDRASIGLAYANYETHRPAATPGGGGADGGWRKRARNGYLNRKYGYCLQPANRLGYWLMHLLPPPWRLEWDHYARHLPRPAAGRNRLLDVGCGNGEFLLRARSQGWDVTGLDQDESALSHAKAAGLNVVRGDTTDVALEFGSFDAITCHQVIEHAHDPAKLLKSIFNWLRPGGSLWIGTPNISSTLHQRTGRDWILLHPPQHLVILSPNALCSIARAAGFRSLSIIPRGYSEYHYLRSSIALSRWNENTHFDAAAHRHTTLSLRRFARMELESWIFPRRGSDMVLVATR
jgi:2-polyprenyl-3-methyl-5-hydroxy-6-metoxy-1,4-benzoquinol methylase